ncbi:alpha-galactosidase [Parasphaerochaeta coccoides]|uniref:Alpha-galactosidase n=1 Tax=Parasphaerochaeta coccoides (strain ATCC BAA-1237 / DSM 17374 / SPN1) TaxID=760011 RepID=F4GH95_PARC1|nr:alpha-galactosidase [Parasphaerochaeta coccoides]AEC01994.1 Alpha-galactosidase [Parasphaerochaeta coccoides DSM 17374]
MIHEENGLFKLDTLHTSLWFRVTRHGHLEHIHYGDRLSSDQDADGLLLKQSTLPGSSILYDQNDPYYCLDTLALEWSGIGRGDYRQSPVEIKMPDASFTCDFIYKSHEVSLGSSPCADLPSATGEDEDCSTVKITLEDISNHVELFLYYTVYEATDVITRRVVLKNNNRKSLLIRRLMSMMMDMPDRGFKLITFDGGWIREGHRHERPVAPGIYINSSTTGASSNRHNAGFILSEKGTGEDNGRTWGFNLVYSGNHYGSVELSVQSVLRIQVGINPYCFEWELGQGECFETPEAVMTFSSKGFNGLGRNFHDFINKHIVRGSWRDAERPVLFNTWEANFFNFTERKLIRLARQARILGIETFVLDDGWFGTRDDDRQGLGDYSVNKKKLPKGLKRLSRKIRVLGMNFGLWFEPEMINENSELYRNHPEYAVTTPGKEPTRGRNQLVLDLCNPEVRNYIVSSLSRVMDEAEVSYVKWDMNRHISDGFSHCLERQGEFFHRYILGLYDILRRVFTPRPHILLESCSSGGNRFDLGMLCFSPQIWTSDDTDPIERLKIQGGLSCLYPLSTMGAHVSDSPHQQTLRATPLHTRFNTASFGSLGYELDLKNLTPVQRKEIQHHIAFYKEHRRTFQYGRFYRLDSMADNTVNWLCVAPDGSEAIAGVFRTLSEAAPRGDILALKNLVPSASYTVTSCPQMLSVRSFGGLVKHITPITLKPDGLVLRLVDHYRGVPDGRESYSCKGDTLMSGLHLATTFLGTGHNEHIRLMGDYGSSLYVIKRKEAV